MRRYSLMFAAALAALSTSAFAAGTLTIYTYESFTSEWGPGPKVKEAFEKVCDCTVAWVKPSLVSEATVAALGDGLPAAAGLPSDVRLPE